MYNFALNHYYRNWTTASVELNRNLRALWEQHVFWTRLTVNSIVDGLADVKPTTERLLRNPDDFAAALAPIYGPVIASEFAKLLTEHLTIAAELVTNLKAGNTQAAQNATKRWYANADQIAVFLSKINPYWSVEQWRHMLYEHLGLLTEEVTSRIAQDYTRNVALADPIQAQALGMADVMTSGIVQQFPMQF
ncbi:acetylglutamate kinase [Paenibacillus yanchengensis]|uniref:Acetylglutamate kinase n=1 Tax=Paenibacillus yanchengensis TaxID=2035833 RepID=A0ABW4YHX6_9BACL